MAEYAGSAVVVQWIHSGGTLTMSGETRSCNISPSIEKIDATAGSDTDKVFLPSFSEWEVSWEGVAQNNATAATSGTAYAQALKPGVTGTVNVGPFGTAGSALKYSMPAFCNGASIAIPYADVTTISTSWSANSGGSMTIGTW